MREELSILGRHVSHTNGRIVVRSSDGEMQLVFKNTPEPRTSECGMLGVISTVRENDMPANFGGKDMSGSDPYAAKCSSDGIREFRLLCCTFR